MVTKHTDRKLLVSITLLLMLIVLGAVPIQASEVLGNNGITIKTQLSVTDDMLDSRNSFMLASLDPLVAMYWRLNNSGWMPIWELVLVAPGFPEKQFATVMPMPNHVYETLLSYSSVTGTVGVKVTDATENKALALGGTQISPNEKSLNPTTDGKLLTNKTEYEPFAVSWSVGATSGASFVATSIIEPDVPTQIRLTLPGPADGEYRLTADDGEAQQLLASMPLKQNEIQSDLQLQKLPLGKVALVLQYLNGTEVTEIGRQPVVVGKVQAHLDAIQIDPAHNELRTNVVLHSDSKLYGTTLTLQTQVVEMLWDSAAQTYLNGQVFTQNAPITTSGFIAAGEQHVPVTLPLPDKSALWRVDFKVSSAPDIRLDQVMTSSYFTTGERHAQLADGRNLIRIGSYNILGFEGYPKEQAQSQLGGMEDPRRFEHFSQVIGGLDADILCVEEGSSVGLLAEYARALGYNLAGFTSTTAYPGGILTRFPVLESHPFVVTGWQGVVPYSRYGGAALLDIGGVLVWVVSLHAYPHDAAVRVEEAKILGNEVDKLLRVSPNIIVGGDFNETIRGPLHQALKTRGFINVLEKTGAMQSIDHLYVSPSLSGLIRTGKPVTGAGFRLGAPGTGSWANSDHVPVLMELALP